MRNQEANKATRCRSHLPRRREPARALRQLTLAIALVLGGAFGAACIDEADDVDEYRAAVPRGQAVSIEVPVESEGANEAGLARQSSNLVGQRAELYTLTRNVSLTLNTATGLWLGLVHVITAFPPTQVTPDRAIWGPFNPALDPLTYRLTVIRLESGRYDYVLDARPKQDGDDAFVPILEGNSSPDARAHGGNGTLDIYFDNMRLVQPEGIEEGAISISYDVGERPWSIDMEFDDFVPGDGNGPIDASYHYAVAEDGSGNFDFATLSDVDDDSIPEALHVVSRWTADGTGTSDAAARDESLGDGVLLIRECWDTVFARTYYSVDPFDHEEGDAGACAFEAQEVAPPSFDAPG